MHKFLSLNELFHDVQTNLVSMSFHHQTNTVIFFLVCILRSISLSLSLWPNPLLCVGMYISSTFLLYGCIKYYHKVSGLRKKHSLITWQFCRSEVWAQQSWAVISLSSNAETKLLARLSSHQDALRKNLLSGRQQISAVCSLQG